MTQPLVTGDPVVLYLSGQAHPTRVLAILPWAWILVPGPNGRHYLEVVFNRSAADWTRLILLDSFIAPSDTAEISRIADALAYRPDRSDVSDVQGAERLLPVKDRITRDASA